MGHHQTGDKKQNLTGGAFENQQSQIAVIVNGFRAGNCGNYKHRDQFQRKIQDHQNQRIAGGKDWLYIKAEYTKQKSDSNGYCCVDPEIILKQQINARSGFKQKDTNQKGLQCCGLSLGNTGEEHIDDQHLKGVDRAGDKRIQHDYLLLRYSNQNLWNEDCFLGATGIRVPSVR